MIFLTGDRDRGRGVFVGDRPWKPNFDLEGLAGGVAGLRPRLATSSEAAPARPRGVVAF